jgi:hypothetical protein
MVGLEWTELPTPHPVIEPVSENRAGDGRDADSGELRRAIATACLRSSRATMPPKGLDTTLNCQLGHAKENPNPPNCLSTNSFYLVGRHLIPVTVVEMSPQIIHDGSNLIVAHHRSEWWHSALSVDDDVDGISARFEISVAHE